MNDELSYSERKEWAKLLYTKQGKTIKDTALETGVVEAVVCQWILEGAWEGIRTSLLTSKANQLEHLYKQVDRLNTKLAVAEDATAKDTDLLFKYIRSIKDLEKEPGISEIIEIFEVFIQWLRRKDLELTKKLVVHFDAFVEQCLAA